MSNMRDRDTESNTSPIPDLLREMIRTEAILHGDFLLSSGRKSPYYIDCRRVTLSAKGARYVAWSVMRAIHGLPVHAIGGPTISADPIVGACLCTATSWARDDLVGFLVRSEVKGHGTGQLVEGPVLKTGSNVVLVDDVATSGKSLKLAADAIFNELGYNLVMVIVLLDRLQGAREIFEKCGIPFKALTTIRDFGLEPIS